MFLHFFYVPAIQTPPLATGGHIVRISPSSQEGSTSKFTHDLVLPLWKSNVSVTLMLDKKAKRYVKWLASIVPPASQTHHSALSLRLFGEDITTAGREAKESKNRDTKPAVAGPSNVVDALEQVEEETRDAEMDEQ
jgi:multisite-specific tRNA:(cytosine-C5)-methyltransferase